VQLYPKLAELLEKKRDQHRADAVLLAAFGLSQVLSGPRA
jgi:hypothetical protein